MIEHDDSDDGLLAGIAIFILGAVFGWPLFAPVVAACVIGGRLLYGAVQMYRAMRE